MRKTKCISNGCNDLSLKFNFVCTLTGKYECLFPFFIFPRYTYAELKYGKQLMWKNEKLLLLFQSCEGRTK